MKNLIKTISVIHNIISGSNSHIAKQPQQHIIKLNTIKTKK